MRKAPVSWIWAAGLVLVVSCGGPDTPTNRSPSEAGISLDGGDFSSSDDGGGGTPTSGCPSTQPKVGETCGPGVDEGTSCDFVLGECTAPDGKSYTESSTYCCLQGVWEICGGKSPCDDFDASVAPEPGDAGAVGRDGGVDASDAHGDTVDAIDATPDGP